MSSETKRNHPVDFSFELWHCRRLHIFRQKLYCGCLCSSNLPLPAVTAPGNVKPFHICIKRRTEGFGTPLWSVLEVSGRARSLEQTFDPELALLNLWTWSLLSLNFPPFCHYSHIVLRWLSAHFQSKAELKCWSGGTRCHASQARTAQCSV